MVAKTLFKKPMREYIIQNHIFLLLLFLERLGSSMDMISCTLYFAL